MSAEIIELIKASAAEHGIDSFGICSLESIRHDYPDQLDEFSSTFTSAIVFGIPLPRACLDGLTDRPTLLYLHHYRQLNYILDRFTMQSAIKLEQAGAKALAIPASQITSWEPIPRGHISHKLLAHAAGLGWWGRNNLLVTKDHGARIRLASILTDLPVESSNSNPDKGCGSCRACVAACPANAIKEDPENFDSAACSAKLLEFQKLRFIGQRICGICVKACKPKNH